MDGERQQAFAVRVWALIDVDHAIIVDVEATPARTGNCVSGSPAVVVLADQAPTSSWE
jgi:hypothetical protein